MNADVTRRLIACLAADQSSEAKRIEVPQEANRTRLPQGVPEIIGKFVGANDLYTVDEIRYYWKKQLKGRFDVFFREVLLPAAKKGLTKLLVEQEDVSVYFKRFDYNSISQEADDRGIAISCHRHWAPWVPPVGYNASPVLYEFAWAHATDLSGRMLLESAKEAWDAHEDWKRLWQQELFPASQNGDESCAIYHLQDKGQGTWDRRVDYFRDLNVESVCQLLRRRGLQVETSNDNFVGVNIKMAWKRTKTAEWLSG